MASLVLRPGILAEIKRVVFRTTNETGVRLVGEVKGRRYIVRHIIAPGRRAVQKSAYYACDNAYAEQRFNDLLKCEPHLAFLGELHVHTDGHAGLSARDRATVQNVLKQLPFFIAGTIRRRPFLIAPVLFDRHGSTSLTCVLR